MEGRSGLSKEAVWLRSWDEKEAGMPGPRGKSSLGRRDSEGRVFLGKNQTGLSVQGKENCLVRLGHQELQG